MKKALFFINSLSNGGAERVVINLSNEMIKEDYNVDIIILGKNSSNIKEYDKNNKINVYSLNINSNNKIIKMFKMFKTIHKVNSFIRQREKDGKYDIITSHLPMSNFLTRMSIVKNRAIYVFHLPAKRYDKFKFKFIYKLILKFMFNNRKIAAVSNGVRNEAIKDYNFRKEKIMTIYNPIDINEIHKKMTEPIEFDKKYFLHVGRFGEQKRQELTLDIFYQGEYYKEYDLIFCGEGDTKEKIKQKAKDLNISDKVHFLEWQSNIYKWMRNSEMLLMNSSYESFAMVIVEALASGTKVVSYNCDFGPSEIMKGEFEKYLVKKDQVAEYIKTINFALKSFPKAKNKFIDKCNPNKIVNQYLEFMKK